jgi:hypothetical protein
MALAMDGTCDNGRMDGWHTTVTTPSGEYYSPPEDSRDEFLALLKRLTKELPVPQPGQPVSTDWTITHRK